MTIADVLGGLGHGRHHLTARTLMSEPPGGPTAVSPRRTDAIVCDTREKNSRDEALGSRPGKQRVFDTQFSDHISDRVAPVKRSSARAVTEWSPTSTVRRRRMTCSVARCARMRRQTLNRARSSPAPPDRACRSCHQVSQSRSCGTQRPSDNARQCGPKDLSTSPTRHRILPTIEHTGRSHGHQRAGRLDGPPVGRSGTYDADTITDWTSIELLFVRFSPLATFEGCS